MLFSSLTFLFVFLPLTALLYFIPIFRSDFKKELTKKNIVLLLASLVFYAWGEPVYIVLMLLSICFNYGIGLDIENTRRRKKNPKKQLVFAVIFNLLVLGFFKYSGFVEENVNSIFNLKLNFTPLALPIGISFYTFQAMSYVIDVYRRKVRAQKNLIPFAVYITMFPQLIAGPIVQYSDIEKQLVYRRSDVKKASVGLLYFVRGFGKKVIFANTIGAAFTEITQSSSNSAVSTWFAIFCYAMQIYFDFSGYSDMAIGLGKIFGFDFPKNFDFPYISKSITEFWRRWHISLSSWFRDYVYIPLGGNRKGTARQILNLAIVWTLTGLWHGADWNFILWGMYYAILLILEKFVFGKFIEKLPGAVRHVLTFIFVCIGWALFAASSLSECGGFLASMFGANGLVDENTLYYLSSYIVPLIITSLSAFGVFRYLPLPQDKTKKLALQSAGYIAVFIVCIVCLVSESYNPFLYFRF